MNKYFIEILKIKNSVIIPGLGSLMITNTKTGKIVLSPHLKFDDGTLVNFIAEKEGIDKAEAKNKVSKFVREIEAELDKGESYDIYQFGKITKNEKGEPVFDMDSSLLKDGGAVTTKVVEKKPVTELKKEDIPVKKEEKPQNVYVPPTEIKKKEEVVDKIDSTKDNEKVIVDPKKNETSAKTIAANKAKADKLALAEKKKLDKAKADAERKADKLKLAQAKKDKAKAKKTPKEGEDKKKKKRLVPILLLLITLGALGTGAYLFRDDLKKSFGMTDDVIVDYDADEHNEEIHGEDVHTEELVEEVGDTTEVVESDIVDEVMEPKIEEVVQTQPVNTSVNGSFHTIGGGFSEESNATNYATKVGGTVLGRFDNLYLVAIKSYDSMADAKADLSNVQGTEASAWIFKYAK